MIERSKSKSLTAATRRAKRLDDIIARHAPAVGRERRKHAYDLTILQSLRQVIRATDLYSRQLKAKHNLTVPQLICLLTVTEDGPMTVTLLAQRVHLSTSTIVGILDRLESKDLVTRVRGDNDRRTVQVSATAKGRRSARHAPSPLQENLVRELAKLPVREQRSIAQSLQRLAELMQADELDAAPLLGTGELDD